MKSYFKSKFFYIMTALTLCAVIVPTVLYSMGLSSLLRSAVNSVISPIQKLSSHIVDALDGYISYFYAFNSLAEENKALKTEINELKEELYQSRELEEQYDWLSQYLELKMQHSDFQMTPASVYGRESGNYSRVMILDSGTSEGIQRGMTVMSGSGILGFISEVGPNWAKATTLIESSSSIGAYAERSGVTGIIKGDFSLASEGLCKMEYLDEDADIKEGDRILSSGYGSVYPRGLIIGYVEKIELNELSRNITAIVRPASQTDNISQVMVICDYETYSE